MLVADAQEVWIAAMVELSDTQQSIRFLELAKLTQSLGDGADDLQIVAADEEGLSQQLQSLDALAPFDEMKSQVDEAMRIVRFEPDTLAIELAGPIWIAA